MFHGSAMVRRFGTALVAAALVGAVACAAPPPTQAPAWSANTAGTNGHIDLGLRPPIDVAGRGDGVAIALTMPPEVVAIGADGNADWTWIPADAVGVGPVAAGPDGVVIAAERVHGAPLATASSPDEYDPAPRLVRLLPNGQADQAFGTEGHVDLDIPLDPTPLPGPVPQFRQVSGMSVDTDGGVVVVVRSYSQNQGGLTCAKWGRPYQIWMVRLTSTGTADPAFNGGAPLAVIDGNNGCDQRDTFDHLTEDRIATRPDGRIVLNAAATSPLVQVLADGSGLDPTFGDSGRVTAASLPNWWGRNSPEPLGLILGPDPDASAVFGVASKACMVLDPTDPPCFSGYVSAKADGTVDANFAGSGSLFYPPMASIMPITPLADDDGSFWLARYTAESAPTGTEWVLHRTRYSASGAEIESIDVDWPPRPQLLVGRTGGAYSPLVGPQQVADGSGRPYLLGLQADITDGGGVIGTVLVRLP